MARYSNSLRPSILPEKTVLGKPYLIDDSNLISAYQSVRLAVASALALILCRLAAGLHVASEDFRAVSYRDRGYQFVY
jgi:hypothetical protein